MDSGKTLEAKLLVKDSAAYGSVVLVLLTCYIFGVVYMFYM